MTNQPEPKPTMSGKTEQPWFMYDGQGMQFFGTAKEAADAAQDAIDDYRSDCDPDWPVEVEWVCWGRVHQEATKVAVVETEYCDFILKYA